MKQEEFLQFLENVGKDPSRLIFEDELTGIFNRRFLLNFFQHKVTWEDLASPLSLIMIDIDHFKEINDTYGHGTGDQALIWMAGLIRSSAGDRGVAIRYAGDELMILLTGGGKEAALRLGEELLQRVRGENLAVEGGRELSLTISLGVATAPDDACAGQDLIRQADAALYAAKRGGRNRLADAGTISPQEVLVKTALHQLGAERIAGRHRQLAQMAKLLKDFSEGQNQFVIVEGGEGMGKTTFLETVQNHLAREGDLRICMVRGNAQEKSHPYYLARQALLALLQKRPDRGVAILESLTPPEMDSISLVLPRPGQERVPGRTDPEEREGLFNTLFHLLAKLLGDHPLVLLVDDLELADEATLILWRALLLHRDLPLFLGGASLPLARLFLEESIPLGRFYERQQQDLAIQRISLTPFTAGDILEHLETVFPQARVPENFEKELARITQGNPLFLAEILRHLVLEQRIALSGQQWTIHPGSLPNSLEELVQRQLAALDPPGRTLLDQLSAFGGAVSLSQLAGGSQTAEAQILESLDQAAAQGLLRMDYQEDDARIRFPSRRVLEIVYAALPEEKRRQLHERIGRYQESLHLKNLLPSAAVLAHHFRQAANPEKFELYHRLQEIQRRRMYDPLEAIQYTGERRSELPPPGAPLDPASLALVPAVIRGLAAALSSIQLYPPGSDSITGAIHQLGEAVDSILERNEQLTIFQVRQVLMINGQRLEVQECKFAAEDLLKRMGRLELKGIILQRGLAGRELETLLEALGRFKPGPMDKDHWHRFSLEKRLEHVELKQVRYAIRVESADPEKKKPSREALDPRFPLQLFARGQELEPEDLGQVPEILRSILHAARKIRLYPLSSKTISASLDQLLANLRVILDRRPVLTLARVGMDLLINGVRLEASAFQELAEGFRRFLEDSGLSSLTFLENLSLRELRAFVDQLGRLRTGQVDREFWMRFAEEGSFSGLLFNQVRYETRVTRLRMEGEAGRTEEIEPIPEEIFETYLRAVPGRVADLLLQDQEEAAGQILRRLFRDFQLRFPLIRERTVETCRRLLESLTLGLQPRLARQLAEPLRRAFAEEREPAILREMGALLHRLAIQLILFSDYLPASRILLELTGRRRRLEEAKDPHASRLAKILDRKLDLLVQRLLMEDLRSSEPLRQQKAVQVLGSLGRVAGPMLIEVIKKEAGLRVRQMAAGLLAEMGGAAEPLKKELALEGGAAERARILEVVDGVTRDLQAELASAFGDETPEVRQAAFRLAERLNEPPVNKLLLELASGRETAPAVEAIQCLGKLKPPPARAMLIKMLLSSRETERLTACCRALGQMSDPAAIDALARILSPRGFLRRRRNPQVRAAAALALGQIPHPRALDVLASKREDPDPRIREIACTLGGVLKPGENES